MTIIREIVRNILVTIFLLRTIGDCFDYKLTCPDVRGLVAAVNNVRLRVAQQLFKNQPPAGRMTLLIWHDDLAEPLKEWTEELNSSVVAPYSKIKDDVFGTLGVVTYTYTRDFEVFDPVVPVEAWAAESIYYKYQKHPGPSVKTKNTDRYTQLVSTNSSKFFCDIHLTYKKVEVIPVLVCLFQKAGNIKGLHPYEKGGRNGRLLCGTPNCSARYGMKCS